MSAHTPRPRLSDQPTVTLDDLRDRLTRMSLIHRWDQIKIIERWLRAVGGPARADAAMELRATDYPAWRVDPDALAEMLDELSAADRAVMNRMERV